MSDSKKLNLGCGSRYANGWINADLNPISDKVVRIDVLRRLPFPNNYFDVVYHSHLLEHLPPTDGEKLLKECLRILKPKGVIRIAVPDLEMIARAYIKSIEDIKSGKRKATHDHEWMMLELFDQMVRTKSGGKMIDYLMMKDIPNKDFVVNRVGLAAIPKRMTKQLVLSKLDKMLIKIFLLFKRGGSFESSGEKHRWMYDEFSLKLLLEKIGFVSISKTSAKKSSIALWTKYNLDIDKKGKVIKPDSLFMEARK